MGYGMNWLEPYMLITCLSYLIIFGSNGWSHTKAGYLAGGAISISLPHNYLLIFLIINPAYIKSLGGLLQAWTFGEPGFTPAYMFLKNSVLSTLFFSLAFRWAIALKPDEMPYSQVRSPS